MVHYSRRFYQTEAAWSLQSAKVVVPLVCDLLRPRSVVDVGCGTGLWLSIFQSQQVEDVWGIDGPWVKPEMLCIPPSHFRAQDLTKPVAIDRRFDLAVSLEVAEHLPESAAHQFVETLVHLSSFVLFSAAIPLQGGTHHVNEQWPEYWAAIFARHGYLPVDCIRPLIWDNEEVGWWYTQNTILYVKEEDLKNNDLLHGLYRGRQGMPLSMVHPRKFISVAELSLAIFNPSQPFQLLNNFIRRCVTRLKRRV